MEARVQFLKKRKLCLQNLTKEWKQPPVVILQQANFLQYVYSMLVDKNHQKIRSRCLAHEFSFTDIFNDINHGYKAALLKKNSLWLLSLYMDMASHCYYEKRCRTVSTAIVSYLLKYFYSLLSAELSNFESRSFCS